MSMEKMLDDLFEDKYISFSRNNPEPFRGVFKNVVEISENEWKVLMMEKCIDFEPINSYISSGEYGNCMLNIFYCKYDEYNLYGFYYQYTFQYKGNLEIKYYHVNGSII